KAPECEARMPGTLRHVVAGTHQRGAAEREDHAERVVGTQATEGQPRHAEVQRRPGQFGRGIHADRHADHAPHGRSEQEQAHDVIVVGLDGLHGSPTMNTRPPDTRTGQQFGSRETVAAPRPDANAANCRRSGNAGRFGAAHCAQCLVRREYPIAGRQRRPRPRRSVFSSTRNMEPSCEEPLSAAIALRASWPSISSSAKPLHSPLNRSLAIFRLRTRPCASNNPVSFSSVIWRGSPRTVRLSILVLLETKTPGGHG